MSRTALKRLLATGLAFFMALTLGTPLRAAAEESDVPIVAVEVVPDDATKPEIASSEDAKATENAPADTKENEIDAAKIITLEAESKANEISAGQKNSEKKVKKSASKNTKEKVFTLKRPEELAPAPTPAPEPPQPFCKRGIDVSHHNGDINWQAVKDSGIEFAIIRTGYGWMNWDKQTDRQLRNNIAGAKAVGMPIGAYHYSYATNPHEANLEADFFIDRLRGTQWEYPVFIDLEDKCQRKLTNEQRTEIILTFLQRLRDAGYYTGFYTCLNWQRYMLDISRLGDHQLWIAHWNDNCGCQVPYGLWQHSSHGSIPGINGRVDLDRCYVDYPAIIKAAHLNGF